MFQDPLVPAERAESQPDAPQPAQDGPAGSHWAGSHWASAHEPPPPPPPPPGGAYGSQNPASPYGPYGSQGSYGSQGTYGSQGPSGSQGPYGPGSYAAPGAYGSQGAYGPGSYEAQGPSGPYGPQGPYAAQGPASPGGSGGGRGRRARFRLLAITAAAALAAGAGTALAATAGGSAVLSTSQVVAKTDPGIVDVVSTLGYQNGEAAGTGIVLTSAGLILTNNHVIDGATSIKVRDVGNNHVYTASVVGYSEANDIAVLKLAGASGLTTATLGDSSKVGVGNKVIAIGNAGGKNGTPSVATGRVTALNQSITASDESSGVSERLTGLIRTNAGIQPGDSGGPLTSTSGQVIGIDTAAQSGSPFQLSSSTVTEAFTIPINHAISIANQIEAGKSSAAVHIGSTAFLGIEVTSSGSAGLGGTSAGAQVAGVEPNSAVARAGLVEGDVIPSIGGHSITSSSAIRSLLTGYHPGDKISITWTDQTGQSHTASIVVGSGPAA